MSGKRLKLSDQLRKAIAESGLTQREICKAAGIDQALMSRFMSGKSGFSVDSLDRLAATLRLALTPTARTRPRKRR